MKPARAAAIDAERERLGLSLEEFARRCHGATDDEQMARAVLAMERQLQADEAGKDAR